MSLPKPYWRTIPPRSVIIFLLGVFLLFGTIGFTDDLMEMGRQSTLRLVLSVLCYGAFAIAYAAAGFVLQGKSWIAIVPIFIVQNVAMGLLGNFLPAGPQPVELGAAEIAQIHHRLNLSGFANIAGHDARVRLLRFRLGYRGSSLLSRPRRDGAGHRNSPCARPRDCCQGR